MQTFYHIHVSMRHVISWRGNCKRLHELIILSHKQIVSEWSIARDKPVACHVHSQPFSFQIIDYVCCCDSIFDRKK